MPAETQESPLLGGSPAEGAAAGAAGTSAGTAPAAGAGEPKGGAPATEGTTAPPAQGSADGAKEGEGSGEPRGQEPAGPPETYDLKLADGVQPDAAALTEFSALARSLNLTQEQAQQLVDLQQRLERKGLDEAQAYWREQTVKHREAVKADSELGGAEWEKKVAIANQALHRFGTPELAAFFAAQPWIGSHPEVVRAFYRAGKAISEDTLVTGGDTSPKPRTAPEIMYGTIDGGPRKE